MINIKRVLLHSVLLSCLAVMPISAYGMGYGGDRNQEMMRPQAEESEALPHVEKARARFNFGVYYGRPYYYRPYYYYQPYRPYYYRHYYYPYRPYGRW